MKTQRPTGETNEAIYSNFDHQLCENVREELEKDHDLCAQHAAWDFCGYVWTDGTTWYEEVWRFKAPVAVFQADRLSDLIAQVNAEYGAE